MTAEELWKRSGLEDEYEAWAFGEAADKLADLVKKGIKTATSSAYAAYEAEGEDIPRAGEYSVILDSEEKAVCIIRTVKVEVLPFKDVPAEFAFKEGEGDRSLSYWREVHQAFFTGELQEIGLPFTEDIKVVCEEFEVVYTEDPASLS